MIKKFLILMVLFAGFTACSLDDNNDYTDYHFEVLPIKTAQVPSEFQYGNSYAITVTFDLPSTCHYFYNLYYDYQGTSRIVAINSRVIEATGCDEEPREIEYEFMVQARQMEDYVFKFWKGEDVNGNDIFDEITVPVVN